MGANDVQSIAHDYFSSEFFMTELVDCNYFLVGCLCSGLFLHRYTAKIGKMVLYCHLSCRECLLGIRELFCDFEQPIFKRIGYFVYRSILDRSHHRFRTVAFEDEPYRFVLFVDSA